MPDIDLFAGSAEIGINEGWSERSGYIQGTATLGIDGRICHGIDLGVDLQAAAEVGLGLRLLLLGANANAGGLARVGVNGQVTLDPNVFEQFGLTAHIEAAVEASVRGRLGISLETEYVKQVAGQELSGLPLELFHIFLEEIRVAGGVMGKASFAAMAQAWLQIAGSFREDDEGFTIGSGFGAGFGGGAGSDWFIKLELDNPRRYFSLTVNAIVDEILSGLRDELPPGSDFAIEVFRFIAPATLRAAYEVGQISITKGIADPIRMVEIFMRVLAEELQHYLVDKVAEVASNLMVTLTEEALLITVGRDLSDSDREKLTEGAEQLINALQDGELQITDITAVLFFATSVAEVADPELIQQYHRPLAMLWTAMAMGSALAEAATLTLEGELSALGFGISGRFSQPTMPAVNTMPTFVRQEYLETVDDFDGTALTFDQTVDYLVNIGVAPLIETYVPEATVLLDQLYRATGVTPGDIVAFGLEGIIGNSPSRTELYQEPSTFVRNCVDEVIRDYLFEVLDQRADANEDYQLYMREVARPSIELIVNFVFAQFDQIVAEPTALGTVEQVFDLQTGLSALLYKIVARNLVVLHHIASEHVRQNAVQAFAELEAIVRSDESSVMVQATFDHLDEVLAQLSRYAPLLPDEVLTDDQLAAIQNFLADLLAIAQLLFSEAVFTDARMERQRRASLALLLSLDGHFNDWQSGEEEINHAIDQMQECLFIPDEQAINEIFQVTVAIMVDQAAIVIAEVPPALTRLMLGLTLPALAARNEAAQQALTGLADTWTAAQETLNDILQTIDGLISLAAQQATAVTSAIALASDKLNTLSLNLIRPALLVSGTDNLRRLNASHVVIDGFEAVLSTALAVLGPIQTFLEEVFADIQQIQFLEAAVEGAIANISLQALAGEGSLLEQATADFQTFVEQAIADLLAVGDDAANLFTVSTANLNALTAADFIQAITARILALIEATFPQGVAQLLTPRLMQARYEARKVKAEADESIQKTTVATAQKRYDDAKDRDGTRIAIFSPAPLEQKVARVFTYGPIVPLSVRIRKAGARWQQNGEGGRIQISCNVLPLSMPETTWQYDDARQELTLVTQLRLSNGHITPGLNVLEVSVANTATSTVRETVSFIVDPDGMPPSQILVIDGEASQFNPPGSDHSVADEEYVTLRWDGVEPLDITGWKIRDRARHEYTFGSTSLLPGQALRVRSGGDPANNSQTDVFWGRKKAVWNNTGDLVLLIDNAGAIRTQYLYDGKS